ncbi:MAG: DUF1127 domain-containing protein [Alphaproteobacteria bacterium]
MNELKNELDQVARGVMARPTDIQNLTSKGRRLQAEAMANMPGQGLTAIGRAWRRRQTIKQLQSLSDRMLEDIGLNRGQIVEVATRMAASPTTDTPHRAEPSVQTFLAKVLHAHQRRATIRELENLPDWVLSDIGVSRGRIPAEVDRILEKQSAQAPAGQSGDSPVHELFARLENAIRPLRQWRLNRVSSGQIARLGNNSLSDLGYIKDDVDWVPEDMAKRKIANSSNQPQAGAA